MKNVSDHTDLPWVDNFTVDKGDPNGRNAQTGLADQIGQLTDQPTQLGYFSHLDLPYLQQRWSDRFFMDIYMILVLGFSLYSTDGTSSI
jgi:rhamnogalacturonyl hydrolase YesR